MRVKISKEILMTSRQIEIGNRLLEYLAINGQANTDDLYYHLTTQCAFNSLEDLGDIGMTKEHLKRFSLIEPIGRDEYFFGLTRDGINAGKIGISGWFTNQQNSENNKAYSPTDKFSESERSTINDKLDELFNQLQRLETGQQLTYDDIIQEIEELKKLTQILGKKNWKEILKGKLIDWGLGEISDEGFKLLTKTFYDGKFLNE
jgi:hypothetical protein